MINKFSEKSGNPI